MATDPVHPPVSVATKPAADAHYDEHSGVYGFFRRHQKKLLYTAGLFTLLTFSITGPMTSVVKSLFSTTRSTASIVVNGVRVPLTDDDWLYGQQLARSMRTSIPPGVLPPIQPGEGSSSDLNEVFSILRCAARTEGIEPSLVEVDKAIESLVKRIGKSRETTAAKLARDMSFSSLAEYRALVAEAMRVGNYVRLQSLVVDTSDAYVLHVLTDQEEKITLHIATFDEKKAEADLKAAKPLAEEDLKKWLDGKTERDKRQMQAFDPPRSRLRFQALLLAEGQFDPEQWKDGFLKDFVVSDDQLKNLYGQERENRFKLEDNKYKELDDPAVKAELTRLLQAERVMNEVMAAVRAKQAEALKAPSEALTKAQGELGTAQQVAAENARLATEKTADLTRKKAELAKKPDDAGLKTAVTEAEQAETAAKTAQTEAEGKIEGLKKAATDAETALKAARADYDFRPDFRAAVGDKKGFVEKEMAERKTAEEMKDLDKLGLELGMWPLSMQGAGLPNKGDMGWAPARTKNAIALYQAIEVEPTPLKPWETLKTIAEGAYWTEQAKKLGEEKKKLMEDALLRLAKAKMADKVAEIEGKRQARIDEKLAEWEKKVTGAIETANKQVLNAKPGTQAYDGWQQELGAKKAELAQKDAQKASFEAIVGKAIDSEIATEARKFYRDVIDEAAREASFTVADYGPYMRDLQQQPRFDKAYDAPVVFFWRSHSKLAEGEATDVLQDFTGRAYYVGVCTKVEPLTSGDVTRREFQAMRTGNGYFDFAAMQAYGAYATAFTLEAVEKRYEFQREAAESKQKQASTEKGK